MRFVDPRRRVQFAGRVLLAEDSATNAAVVTSMLATCGISPEIVHDGAAAVQAATSTDFDLILMDVGMPVLDGLEATRLLRKSGVKTPIVALTAHALKEIKDSTHEAGMDGYVTKPLRGEVLDRLLAKWLPTADLGAEAIIDEAAKRDQWGADPSGYDFVADIFRQELEGRLRAVASARSNNDRAALTHEVHAIKGGASNVAANALACCAESLELELRNGADLARLSTRFHALTREADRFLDAIATPAS